MFRLRPRWASQGRRDAGRICRASPRRDCAGSSRIRAGCLSGCCPLRSSPARRSRTCARIWKRRTRVGIAFSGLRLPVFHSCGSHSFQPYRIRLHPVLSLRESTGCRSFHRETGCGDGSAHAAEAHRRNGKGCLAAAQGTLCADCCHSCWNGCCRY